MPAASIVVGIAYLQSVCPSVAVAQEPHGRLVHTGALDAGGQGLCFPAYCDVYIFLHSVVNVALALPSLTLWQDGHTGGEHCSGSPMKLTACIHGIFNICVNGHVCESV